MEAPPMLVATHAPIGQRRHKCLRGIIGSRGLEGFKGFKGFKGFWFKGF